MAIAMKLIFIISLHFSIVTVLGQSSYDTCLTKTEVNDLKSKIYQLSEQKEAKGRQIRLLTELMKVDTIFQSTDSLIIVYIGKNRVDLKREKQIYSQKCMTDSAVTHFNLKGQITYSEWWRITCDNPDIIDNEPFIFKYKGNYYRYDYDKEYRIIKQVIHLSTPYTRRILYSYDSKGNATRNVISIDENDFWD